MLSGPYTAFDKQNLKLRRICQFICVCVYLCVCGELPPPCARCEQGFELPEERDSGRGKSSVREVTRGLRENRGSWELCAR